MSTSLIPADWHVPQEFRERLGTSFGRQRAMSADGHLLIVVHQPPDADERSRRGRLLWRDSQGCWKGSGLGEASSPVRVHLQQYAERIEALEQMEENAKHADDYIPLLEGLAPLVRAARNLEQVMQDARKAIPADRELIDFRDQAYELSRTFDLLYTDAKNAMEIAIIRRAEQQTRAAEQTVAAANRFNLLVAFFFPITTFAGVMGINMQNGLEELPAPWPILTLVGIGLISGTILAVHVGRIGKAS